MKKTVVFLMGVLALGGSAMAQSSMDGLRKGAYFGEEKPGLTPKIFAPDHVSLKGRYEGAISFSPDMSEMYFTAKNDGKTAAIYTAKKIKGVWSKITKANFTKGKKDQEIHPFVSPDGNRIYFTAHSNDYTDTGMWYVPRRNGKWGEARPLDMAGKANSAFFYNQAKDGQALYFNLETMKTDTVTHTSAGFSDPKPFEIGSGFHHAFIAPSGDYLIVAGRNKTDGRKDNDLYVSFKMAGGSWGMPINLGDAINTDVNEKSPSITHDGKFLFFGRDQKNEEGGFASIFWVSTKVIEKLSP